MEATGGKQAGAAGPAQQGAAGPARTGTADPALDRPDPLVGAVLDGRYRVDAVIASGGMATVYLATDSRLDRTVAVKVMRPMLAQDPDFVDRFGPRLAHLNTMLAVLRPLAATQRRSENPNG